MANVKQLNMLSAKARAAGMDFDREASKDLTNEDIDELVKKFDANGGKQEVEQKRQAAPETTEINGARFGMVYKIVIDRMGHGFKDEYPERFIDSVVEEYKLATKAEAAVSASASASTIRMLNSGDSGLHISHQEDVTEPDDIDSGGINRSYDMNVDLVDEHSESGVY